MLKFSGILLRVALLLLTTAVTACSGATFFLANAPNPFGSFRRTADVAYGAEQRQRLDVYVPKRGARGPVVIFWYGGSWTMGTKSQYAFVGAALAARGYLTVIPDYRLYPEVKFPQLMDDGARAVAWVHQHAQEFGGDPDRLVLMGHSAGAHMATMLAVNRSYLQKVGVAPQSIAALIGLSGPYGLEPNDDTLRTIFGPPNTPVDYRPLLQPMNGAPPALLLHGQDDTVVYAEYAQKMAAALEQHGVSAQVHIYPHRGHADTIASFAVLARGRTPALNQTVEFLDSLSAQTGPSH
jgi:acetyl esterase/lipase